MAKYKHKKTGDILIFVKSYGGIYLLTGKKYRTVGREVISNKYICSKENLIPIEEQGKLF